MEEQPEPSASNCPYCGGAPEYDPNHVLSASGYTHDDVHFTCEECGETWACGVPIGEHDGSLAAELFCDSCQQRYGLPHRIQVRGNVPGIVVLHMKCPNADCHYFWTVRRETDDGGVMLYGYPQITGSIEEATADYGYDADLAEYDGPTEPPDTVEISGRVAAEAEVAGGVLARRDMPECDDPGCIIHGMGTRGCPNADADADADDADADAGGGD